MHPSFLRRKWKHEKNYHVLNGRNYRVQSLVCKDVIEQKQKNI